MVNLDAGFAGLTADVINQYAIGYHSGNLDREDFNENVRDGINALFKMSHLIFFVPILQTIMKLLPLSVLQKANPSAFALADQKMGIHKQVSNALASKDAKDGSIIETLSHSLPEHLRNAERLTNEMFALLIGGTETTARSLSVAIFHLLSNDQIRAKLRDELRSVMPTAESRPTWNQLEQLPYMVALSHAS